MGFWERTWKERSDEVHRRFGPTQPPGFVTSFSWDDIRLPGACALTFPPVHDTNNPRGAWHRRPDWLYLTIGLTQPLDEEQVLTERQTGSQYSSRGFELGILAQEHAAWPIQSLYLLLSHVTEGVELKWGDRFAFGFKRLPDGNLEPFTGKAEELRIDPIGAIRALLFWPYLFPNSEFVTSTGKAMIFIATGITEDEWDLAKATTTAHVLLLLCRAGIGQRTDPFRESILLDDNGKNLWREIEGLEGEQAHNELDAGIEQWNRS